MVGAMPQIVAADVDGAKAQDIRRMQRNLIQTFRALELLGLARLCHFVTHSDANGLALGGEVNSA